ncbi:glutathione S-transferase, partial [Francisella tularensis subsp. holarctica]|nr:glutathione S-transferase [Francisella tularensis subsp. holarctica]
NRKALLIYIDERFPAPSLIPNGVNERIKIRLSLDKIDNEWYPVLDQSRKHRSDQKMLESMFKDLQESLLAMEKAFTGSEFFISSGFTLAYCSIAALIICLES